MALSLNNLHHIFIAQLVVQTHALRLVLHRRPPHPRVLELPRNVLMQTVAEVSHRGVLRMQNHRLLVIGNLTLLMNSQKYFNLWLCINTDNLAVLPDLLQQLI